MSITCLFIRQNIHEIEQYLSDNCSITVTGCYIISISEMNTNFGKFSGSSRQIQKIVFIMKNCVFIDLNIRNV